MAATKIKHSVGKNGTNIPDDVRTVRTLLNKFLVPGSLGGPPLQMEGKVGKPTINAIKAFQAVYLGHNNPDGRVDPGGKTLTALDGPITQPRLGDPHDKIATSVYYTLGLSPMDRMLFVFDGISFTPKLFRDVGEAIRSRRLNAYYDPSMGPNAQYFHKGGYMLLGFAKAATATQKSVIVHEAAHAVCDLRAVPMPGYQAEAIGHLAQAIYYYHATGDAIRTGLTRVNDLLDYGANIAKWMHLHGQIVVRQQDVQEMYRLASLLPTVQQGAGFYYDGW